MGAVGADGRVADFSQPGPHVDVVAFGDGVTVLAPLRGHRRVRGTSFAAPFVSATVALLRERFPGDSASQLTQRVLRSADPAPGGGPYGAGLLNPYRALSEESGPVVAGVSRVSAGPAAGSVPVAGGGRWWRAGVFAAGGVGVGVLVGLVLAVVGRGRRRGWQAGTGHDQMPG